MFVTKEDARAYTAVFLVVAVIIVIAIVAIQATFADCWAWTNGCIFDWPKG